MFTHLHTHSHFSFLDSPLSVESVVETACRLRMPAIALTDTNGFYGVIPFWKKAKSLGVKPIIGVEIDQPGDIERRDSAQRSGEDAQDRVGRGAGEQKPETRRRRDANASTIRPLARDLRAVLLARDS